MKSKTHPPAKGIIKKKERGDTASLPSDIFKAAADISDAGIVIVHQDKVIYANTRFLTSFRLNMKDVIGTNLLRFVQAKDQPVAKKEQERNRNIVYELKGYRGDREPVDLEVSATPVLYEKKVCRLLLIRDITTRKSVENHFRSYSGLLNSLPQAIYVLSSNGDILFSNNNGTKMAASVTKDNTSPLGTSLMDYIMPEYQNTTKLFLAELKSGVGAGSRFVKFKSMGEPRSIEMSAVSVEWEGGKATMVVCEDVSLEEQMEKSEIAKQAMLSVNEHLQWEIEKHAELQDRLKKMVEEKEWLLKEVNHRVKNNLQILTSILNLQINQMKDNKLVPVIREFQNRFFALTSIYSSLYRRGESEEIDLSKYLRDLAHSLSVSYAGPENKITIACSADSMFVEYDDAITFGLIVNELISNSIKYAFPNGRKGLIEVKLKKKADQVSLIVADNGIGKKDLLKPDSNNTLGLQLVESLVTQLKDSQIIETISNKGTRYEITCTLSSKVPEKAVLFKT